MRQCFILFEEVVVSEVHFYKLENDCMFMRGSRWGGGSGPPTLSLPLENRPRTLPPQENMF